MQTVLVADDEDHIRQVVCFALNKAGFATVEATNGAQAVAAFAASRPALVILDILMPELDGTEVCRQIRRESNVPIVFLSSKDEELDRILGLELGGDDYLTKPFSPRELVARVRAVLRRGTRTEGGEEDRLTHGRLSMDIRRFKAWWDGRELVLTATEFGMLRVLLTRPGQVYSRQALMEHAYDLNRIVSERTIDSHLRRLRAKLRQLGADPIETVHGVGFRLTSCQMDEV